MTGPALEIGGAAGEDAQRARSTRHAGTATRSAAWWRSARAACRRASARTRPRPDRLDGRLAAALMGIQAVKGVEIGEGFALARRRGSEAHDEILPGLARETNRAGGLEAGVTNGEEVVVRAAMKPLPTLMRPLRSVDLASGDAGEALVERSDTAAVEALAVVAEAAVAWARQGRARKFGGDALVDVLAAHGAYLERIRAGRERVRPPRRADRLHGRGKVDCRRGGRGPPRPLFVDLDQRDRTGRRAPAQVFAERGEPAFREAEEGVTVEVLSDPTPAVLALGGGDRLGAVRDALRMHALTVLLDVGVDEAWARVGSEPPPAGTATKARSERCTRSAAPLYEAAADERARDAQDVVLAAAGIDVAVGALERLGELVIGDGPVALVSEPRVAGIHGADAQLALGERLAPRHELPSGEEAKSIAAVERLWEELTLDRGGTLAALGGGCVTDVAGFAAATYARGIAWVAIPSTLVGQVDAAIGGKTGVNLPRGKNLVGAFHWPARTIVDPALLETLPENERAGGRAEVVKTGLLAGEPLWGAPPQRSSCAGARRTRRRSVSATRARPAIARSSTWATPSPTRSRRRAATPARRTGRRSPSGCSPPSGSPATTPGSASSRRSCGRGRFAWIGRAAWRALRRDKKALDGRIRLVAACAGGRVWARGRLSLPRGHGVDVRRARRADYR